jgi:flagellar basal-body rod protein FlgG
MIKGIYSSGAALQPRMLHLEVLANNLANIGTTGFKRENTFLEVMKGTELAQSQGKGELAGLHVRQFTDFSEGSLNQTDNPLDVAIQGRGFFAVETPQGICYTRNGNFMLSLNGTVVTSQGYPVLAHEGKLQIPDIQKAVHGNIKINEAGEVQFNNALVGKLRLVDFENKSALRKAGESLFVTEASNQPKDVDSNQTLIRQGFLEESNVDGIHEMIEMIELNRSFESDQKAVQTQDGTLEKTIEVGRI